jgi:glycerol-3-phosphate O-acyltransferase
MSDLLFAKDDIAISAPIGIMYPITKKPRKDELDLLPVKVFLNPVEEGYEVLRELQGFCAPKSVLRNLLWHGRKGKRSLSEARQNFIEGIDLRQHKQSPINRENREDYLEGRFRISTDRRKSICISQ